MWAKFSSHFELENTVGAGKGPPGIETLLSAVKGADKTWAESKESGFGKAKTNVESFLSAMDDHSFIFSVIPDGSLYTSLVTGVISSVVKVCPLLSFISMVSFRLVKNKTECSCRHQSTIKRSPRASLKQSRISPQT